MTPARPYIVLCCRALERSDPDSQARPAVVLLLPWSRAARRTSAPEALSLGRSQPARLVTESRRRQCVQISLQLPDAPLAPSPPLQSRRHWLFCKPEERTRKAEGSPGVSGACVLGESGQLVV